MIIIFKDILYLYLALALKFLHSKDIAHMDLKPQNLLLSSKENPTLKIAGRVFTFEMKD
jgi:serine/threonine-protein kinase ULK/ATG1